MARRPSSQPPKYRLHKQSGQAVVDLPDGLPRPPPHRDGDRTRRLFRWAAARTLVPLAAWHRLRTVENLHAGRSAAGERPPVEPVAEEVVQATLPFMRPQVP